MIIDKITGNWYLKKRFLGGYKVMIEVEARNECYQDCSLSPSFKTYIKANKEQLMKLDIKAI